MKSALKYLCKSLPAALRLLAVLTVYCLRRRALLENFCTSTYAFWISLSGLAGFLFHDLQVIQPRSKVTILALLALQLDP